MRALTRRSAPWFVALAVSLSALAALGHRGPVGAAPPGPRPRTPCETICEATGTERQVTASCSTGSGQPGIVVKTYAKYRCTDTCSGSVWTTWIKVGETGCIP